MADRSLRGMRIGAQSLQSEDGVVFADRADYTYQCEACGQETVMTFSTEAETPETWECRHCGASAVLLVDSKPVEIDRSGEKVARVHGPTSWPVCDADGGSGTWSHSPSPRSR